MSDKSETAPAAERRRRGRRPGDANERRQAVEAALAELTAGRVPFTMGDLADRAGISRATLYRDAGLRDLVGAAGDGPVARPVNSRDYERLRALTETLGAERRALRRQVREAEKRVREAETRSDRLETENIDHQRARRAQKALGGDAEERIRTEAFADGFAAGARAYQQRGNGGGSARGGGGSGADLLSVAARLPRPAILNARKTLARALHPDLYANDPAAALLATELLKQINALVTTPTSR